MPRTSGPLTGADEYLVHQNVDTFARAGTTDRNWTEKVCAMSAATDGSAQLALGIGKYVNRGVMDGWAGISRGREQWTVRASRELAPDPETTVIGPIRYEVLETSPAQVIRFGLDRNDAAPVAFEWTARSEVPPFLEEPEVHTSRDRYRLDADVLRFHQSGTASGWYEIDGVRTTFDDTRWVATRDRSWGVRYLVGAPLEDLAPAQRPPGASGYVLWFPVSCRTADGIPYAIHLYLQTFAFGGSERRTFEGAIEHADGRRERLTDIRPDLRFDQRTRRFLGGTVDVVGKGGGVRSLALEPVGDTGFHLGAGVYGGLDGHWHGQWRGKLHVEGEYVSDCTADDHVTRYGQHRQALVRVTDPAVSGVGYGDLQSIGADVVFARTDRGHVPVQNGARREVVAHHHVAEPNVAPQQHGRTLARGRRGAAVVQGPRQDRQRLALGRPLQVMGPPVQLVADAEPSHPGRFGSVDVRAVDLGEDVDESFVQPTLTVLGQGSHPAVVTRDLADDRTLDPRHRQERRAEPRRILDQLDGFGDGHPGSSCRALGGRLDRQVEVWMRPRSAGWQSDHEGAVPVPVVRADVGLDQVGLTGVAQRRPLERGHRRLAAGGRRQPPFDASADRLLVAISDCAHRGLAVMIPYLTRPPRKPAPATDPPSSTPPRRYGRGAGHLGSPRRSNPRSTEWRTASPPGCTWR